MTRAHLGLSELNISENNKLITAVESQKLLEDSILKIKKWLKKNMNLNSCVDDWILLYFLRACKFDIEKTKSKIESFYLMRLERTEWFSNRDPFRPEIQELLDIGVFLPIKEKNDQNRTIFIIRIAAHDPKIHLQNNVFKVGKMILDLALRMDEEISTYGLVAVFDMEGVTLSHALQLTPTIVRRSVLSWQNYPCKIKMLEFINAPAHVNAVLNTFRLFMTSKMKSRISVSRGTSKLNAILPCDIGGSGKSYKELACYWKNQVELNAEYFKEEEGRLLRLNLDKPSSCIC